MSGSRRGAACRIQIGCCIAALQLQRNNDARLKQAEGRILLDAVSAFLTPQDLAMAAAIGLIAGVVKGVVGFALPMILVSGLGSFLPPEIALAGLIVPSVVTNVFQSTRQGIGAALASLRKFLPFNAVLFGGIYLSAMLMRAIPASIFFLGLGAFIVFFCTIQLLGWRPRLEGGRNITIELAIGAVAGFIGGISGIWGPPLILYLIALEVPKEEQVRVQGVSFLLGAIILFFSHLHSGVLNRETLPFSLLMLVPILLGMAIGLRFQDRIDQARFRRLTLWVLLIVGLNLVRRGIVLVI